ncbi:YhcN/YlaJ family sporulation lipoprotein [Bacillus spongiae]|uniref:YhcN/YlaJ family sporulation lipoprotein n=1 Tax=Bacillus spongiae TaxID=2683610 RepID=A0ABU8H949_9BACI
MRKRSYMLFSILLTTFIFGGCQGTEEIDERTNLYGAAQYDSNWKHGGPMRIMYDSPEGKEREVVRENANGEIIDNNQDNNYHGHWDSISTKAKNSYYAAYNGKFVEEISILASSVENVNEARVIVDRNVAIIGLDLVENDQRSKQQTEERVAAAVDPYIDGKQLYIDSTYGNFARIKVIDNDLRDGGPKRFLAKDVENLIKSLKAEVE